MLSISLMLRQHLPGFFSPHKGLWQLAITGHSLKDQQEKPGIANAQTGWAILSVLIPHRYPEGLSNVYPL